VPREMRVRDRARTCEARRVQGPCHRWSESFLQRRVARDVPILASEQDVGVIGLEEFLVAERWRHAVRTRSGVEVGGRAVMSRSGGGSDGRVRGRLSWC